MRIFVISATVLAVLLAGASVIAWLTLRRAAGELEAIEAEKVELAVAFAELDATHPPAAFDEKRLAGFLTVRKAVAETYDARKPEGENPEPLNPRLRLDMLKTLKSELAFAKMGRAEYVAISRRVRANLVALGGPFQTLADRYKAFGEPPPAGTPAEEPALIALWSTDIKKSMSGEWVLFLLRDLEEK